jgi:hypothetical protein
MRFSSAHGTLSLIYYIPDHKTSLNKFRNFKIMSSIILDDNSMKQENNSRKNLKKSERCELNMHQRKTQNKN